MKSILFAALFVTLATITGYALQEETGICLPEAHQAEQENKIYCHCVAMGGYINCDEKTGHYSYQKWAEENTRREQDVDKKGKQKQPDVPMCKMSCKEDQCDCCAFMDRFKDKRRAVITIPYDAY